MATATLYDEEQEKAPTAASEGQNLIKASLFNLIVLAQNPERAVHCQKLVELITEKFPCKIIFVRADPDAQSDFSHTSRSLLTVEKGNTRVLCDQITIEASLTQFHKIPFLILPHIQPDMPVYLLLGQDPAQDKVILPQIQKYATRIIFDPETIENFHRFSQGLGEFSEKLQCDLIDLNWARTKAWREILAHVFNSEESLGQLNQSRMIQISYVSSPNVKKGQTDIQAIYLQSWLASQLKWNLLSVEREEGCLRISYKYDHASLTISLVPKDTEILEPGAIFSFEAMTHGDYHFLISHENDSKLVKVHSSNPERCDMPYTIFLSNFQSGPALVSEAIYQAQSDHYQTMLKGLTHAVWNQV